jgi:hypothetical protein
VSRCSQRISVRVVTPSRDAAASSVNPCRSRHARTSAPSVPDASESIARDSVSQGGAAGYADRLDLVTCDPNPPRGEGRAAPTSGAFKRLSGRAAPLARHRIIAQLEHSSLRRCYAITRPGLVDILHLIGRNASSGARFACGFGSSRPLAPVSRSSSSDLLPSPHFPWPLLSPRVLFGFPEGGFRRPGGRYWSPYLGRK